jgi:hypothetical protein
MHGWERSFMDTMSVKASKREVNAPIYGMDYRLMAAAGRNAHHIYKMGMVVV